MQVTGGCSAHSHEKAKRDNALQHCKHASSKTFSAFKALNHRTKYGKVAYLPLRNSANPAQQVVHVFVRKIPNCNESKRNISLRRLTE